jgi:lipoyl-dependent peroxiredoxin
MRRIATSGHDYTRTLVSSRFGIAVQIHVKIPNLPTAEARALVEETHDKICPYSHATRGNTDFALQVEGA